MRHPRHPEAPFQLTTAAHGHLLWWLAATAIAAGTGAGALALGLGGRVAVLATGVALLLAAGSLVPEPRVVAHVDRHGIHVGPAAATPLLAWEQVRRIEIGAVGTDHLLVVHGDDGVLASIGAQESPPVTVLRFEAAKVTGLIPGWVRIEARTKLLVGGPVDRGPTPRPDLAL